MSKYNELKKLVDDHFNNYGLNTVTVVTDKGKVTLEKDKYYMGHHSDNGELYFIYEPDCKHDYTIKFTFNEIKYISLHE